MKNIIPVLDELYGLVEGVSLLDLEKKISGYTYFTEIREELEINQYDNGKIKKLLRVYSDYQGKNILKLLAVLSSMAGEHEKAYYFVNQARVLGDDQLGNNEDTILLYINIVIDRVSSLVQQKKYSDARSLLEDTRRKFRRKSSELTNHLFVLSRIIIPAYEELDKNTNDLYAQVRDEVKGQQMKIIEIVGLFSAILAFIITNIQIATKDLSTVNIFSVMIGMASVLVIFSVTMSYTFGVPTKNQGQVFYKDARFIIGFISLIILILLYLINLHQNSTIQFNF